MIFWTFIFEKIEILILRGQKPKILKIRDSHSVERVILHVLMIVGYVLHYNPTFQKHLNVGCFSTQNRETSLKRHFLKKNSRRISLDFVCGCQIYVE